LKDSYIISGRCLVNEMNDDRGEKPKRNRKRANNKFVPRLEKLDDEVKIFHDIFLVIHFNPLFVKNPITAPTNAKTAVSIRL